MNHALVADDHAVMRRGVRDILEGAYAGVHVVEATDGDAVLALLPTHTWDLVILDVVMPGPNILEVVASIRAASDTLPILIFSGVSEIECVLQTLKAGANGFIHKQRATEDLLDAVQQVASGGMYLHPDTAVAIARQLRLRTPPHSHLSLSGRELEVLRAIALGRTIKEIGGDLGVSDKPVSTYLARIREKTGLTRPVEIARYALQHDLVELGP